MQSNHQEALDADAAFLERVLGILASWTAPPAPAPVTSFVYFDFSKERVAARLGPERKLKIGGPVPGGMHLCADPLGMVRVVQDGLTSFEAHEEAYAQRDYAPRMMIMFDPASRTVRIVCASLPSPGAEMQLASTSAAATWTLAQLDATIDRFHFERIIGLPLMGLLTENGQLRRRARRRYREALYFYLRYELGLDRNSGFLVSTRSASVKIRRVSGGELQVAGFGMRAAHPDPANEKAVLGKVVRRIAARRAKGSAHPLHLRCLCCDGTGPCATPVEQDSFTMRPAHLE
ncbi:hypothetical protein D8770_24695 [Methylobacterium sp. DB1607]|nr:hypothetical protein [Methylobacterium sp. DB1607]